MNAHTCPEPLTADRLAEALRLDSGSDSADDHDEWWTTPNELAGRLMRYLAPVTVQPAPDALALLRWARGEITEILDSLGVPQPETPAPIEHAYLTAYQLRGRIDAALAPKEPTDG